MSALVRLRAFVDAALPGTLVPVESISAVLADEDVDHDLTAAEVAAKLGRTASCVRQWCASGELDGAYRLHNREWRIPPAALAAHLRKQAATHGVAVTKSESEPKAVDLAGWRRFRGAG